MSNLSQESINKFRSNFSGKVVTAGDPDYNAVRQIWNAMIDRKPAVFAQCTSTADVVNAVKFGRENNLTVAIRGGGHNIAGNALVDDGLVIDFSLMKNVKVDVANRRATAESGCTLADFDAVVQEHGLAVPLGINSTTGLAGLTLGGGFGWLSRKYGMTVDSLISAEVVLADGKTVRASKDENPDLFWGLRGGGGNFGIVTSFEYQLYPVGPEVLTGLIVFPLAQAKDVLTKFGRYTESLPDDFSVWSVVRKAPPLPFLPEESHGTEVVIFALCYFGDPDKGTKFVDDLRGFGKPVGEFVGVQPYAAWQQAFDPLLTPGARNYWKSHNFTDISEGAIDTIIEYAGKLPSPQCEIFIAALGGQTSRVAPDAMAYSSRDAKYILNVHTRWETADEDQKCIDWAREFFTSSKPYASSGAYMNFLTQEEADRVSFAYGSTFKKLGEIKKKYDPENFFRINQNIKPA